jgi:hypothetical protein
MNNELRNAIDRSIGHNEIVSVDWHAADEAELYADLSPLYDGCIDGVRLDDGTVDVWGYEGDSPDVMDWHLRVTLA